MEQIYDLVILGSGPAGLGASIYAKRADLKTLVLEKEMVSGGQVLTTYEVDNYPGLPGINGFDMGMKFREHADRLGVPFISDEITEIRKTEDGYALTGASDTYEGRALIVATGATHRHLGLDREEELTGRGVSYCATCDGAFFRGRDVAVIGGGDVAVEDAIFLSRLCRKVYVVHRRDELRAAKSLQARLLSAENVEMLWDSVAEELTGEDLLDGLVVANRKTEVDGVFVAVGILPNSSLALQLADHDEGGYLRAGEDGVTSAPGLFAAGDVRTKPLRQIVTAVSDGANCITSVERYLEQ